MEQVVEHARGATTTAAGEPARRALREVAPAEEPEAYYGVADWVALGVHLASLAGALAVLLVVDRNMWFRGDDFDFLAQRGLHGATLSIWAPHNEHWSTLPILLWRAIYHYSALRDARPYLLALYVAHLLLAHVLWRVMRTCGCDLAVATALAAVFAVLGSGGENILWAFQIGFVGSLLLGWLFVLLVNHGGGAWWRDVAAAVVGVASLTTSGVAVTMVVVGGLVAFTRRGWRAALVAVGPPAAAYAVWFELAGRHARTAPQSFGPMVLGIPQYVFTGLERSMASATGAAAFGPLLFLALAFWALRRHGHARSAAAPAVMGVAGTVVFFVVTAMGRDGAGPLAASQSRYVYAVVALLLPAMGLALSELVRRGWGWGARVVTVGAVALVGIWNFGQLLSYRNTLTSGSLRTERQLVAAAAIAVRGPVVPGALPLGNLRAPNLTLGVLAALARSGALPSGVRPGPVDAVDAATQLQVGVTTSPLYEPAGARLSFPPAGFSRELQPGACTVAVSRGPGPDSLAVVARVPSAVLVTPAPRTKGIVELRLVLHGVTGSPTMLAIGSRPQWLDVLVAPAIVELSGLAAGTSVTSCA